jgi:hypothetical protein
MKTKTSELIGPALDWAVAKALGVPAQVLPIRSNSRIVGHRVYLDPAERDEFGMVEFEPSTNWSQGGPIIDSERVATQPYRGAWIAGVSGKPARGTSSWSCGGPTPLVAAMRCYVASKLGDEVEIPDELTHKRP